MKIKNNRLYNVTMDDANGVMCGECLKACLGSNWGIEEYDRVEDGECVLCGRKHEKV